MTNFKMGFKIFTFLFASALFFLISSPTTFANENPEVTKEGQKLKDNFIEMGITEETADKLVQKVINGELLDSQKESELEKLEEDELSIDSNLEKKYIEFNDGSRIMLSLEETPVIPTFQTFGYATGTVTTNSCTSGTGYRNCNVTPKYSDGIWKITFNANVNSVQGGYDKITSISKQAVEAVLYGVVQKKFAISRKNETSSKPAIAEYTNQFSHKTGLYTLSRTLTLYAENDKMYAQLDFY